jgi:hypothetical protein
MSLHSISWTGVVPGIGSSPLCSPSLGAYGMAKKGKD